MASFSRVLKEASSVTGKHLTGTSLVLIEFSRSRLKAQMQVICKSKAGPCERRWGVEQAAVNWNVRGPTRGGHGFSGKQKKIVTGDRD